LLNCAAYITSTPGAVPVAVDFGHWRNPATSPPTKSTPALILVFTNIRNSNDVDVYVVAPACNGGSLYIEKTISVSG